MSTTPDDPLDGAELPTPNGGDDAGVDQDGNEEEHGEAVARSDGELRDKA